MEIFIPDNVGGIIETLEKNGYEAYIVGGCVRDCLLGETPKDYDITTSATPEEVKKCFPERNIIDTGIKHGTVSVEAGDEYVEVTTFRIDGAYENHRKPESVSFTRTLEKDLSRRDFTINAMAYSPRTGIVDKFSGQKDLFKRTVRCVGEPRVRFNEDALRIMRALRFASCLNFEIEPGTAEAIHNMCPLLKDISGERISKELDLTITGASPAAILTEFSDVFGEVIPELLPCVNFDQHSKFHVYDVWTHTAQAVEHSKQDRDIRLALLFHDIAKPECCNIDEDGNGHFPGHESRSAEVAAEIMRRLRYSNDTVNVVSSLVKYHYITPVNDRIVVKRMISKVGANDFFKLTEVMKGDNRAKHSTCFERVRVVEAMEELAKDIIESKECTSISRLDVNGRDIASLGAVGKEIGDILDTLLSLVIEEKLENSKEALLAHARKMLAIIEMHARG